MAVVADLHVHTTNSDGELTIPEIPTAAREAGVECVAVTDHDRYHPDLDAPVVELDGVTVVNGPETAKVCSDKAENSLALHEAAGKLYIGERAYDLARRGEVVELMTVNMGPSHPATHGTLRALCALDGETISAAVCEMGYLHRGFEKMTEQGTYTQVLPYTDRLNYCSAMLNNIGFCKAVEGMFGVEIPERTITLRVIIGELNRIASLEYLLRWLGSRVAGQ